MNLSELLNSKGFTSALIVDDAFDEVPTADDLSMDDEGWSIFIADIATEMEEVVKAFPTYDSTDGNELRRSDEFVRAMWELRGKINDELWNRLFETYERDTTRDRSFLSDLKSRLTNAGLEVKTAGKAIPDDAKQCSIIFADLFLGATQQDFDIAKSIERVKALVAGRESAPPPIVLMSRSTRLQEKKEWFRDEAEMLGALFRVYQKADLLQGATVETTLERLATHHADAVRVASFVAAWQVSLTEASKKFSKLVRRLDLSDYTKIREMLLDFEGQPLGSYMLDVFDRVLQHEIEGHLSTIVAAQELNRIDAAKYPTPYISGSSDLQELVVRSLWQNVERLKVVGNTAGMPVSFGDVLVRQSRLERMSRADRPDDQPDVLVVLTPACDLVRDPGRRRVLLLGGTLNALDSKSWRYKTSGASTPIVQLSKQERMSIIWHLDDQRMLNRDELTTLIGPKGPYSIAIRLRESNALELQQRMLADMGRVGVVSKMPFTFPVEVLLYTTRNDAKPMPLNVPITRKEGGVCITGRDRDADVTQLILTEPSVDEILSTIPLIQEEQVHQRARETLQRLKSSASFRSLLQRGLSAPSATPKGSLSPLKVPADAKSGQEKAQEEIVGLIARNPGELGDLSGNNLKNGAVIIVLNDLELHPVMVGDADPSSELLPPESSEQEPAPEQSSRSQDAAKPTGDSSIPL